MLEQIKAYGAAEELGHVHTRPPARAKDEGNHLANNLVRYVKAERSSCRDASSI